MRHGGNLCCFYDRHKAKRLKVKRQKKTLRQDIEVQMTARLWKNSMFWVARWKQIIRKLCSPSAVLILICVHGCFACMCAYVPCVHSPQGGQKVASAFPELEWWRIVNYHMGAGSEPRSSGRGASVPHCWAISPVLVGQWEWGWLSLQTRTLSMRIVFDPVNYAEIIQKCAIGERSEICAIVFLSLIMSRGVLAIMVQRKKWLK